MRKADIYKMGVFVDWKHMQKMVLLGIRFRLNNWQRFQDAISEQIAMKEPDLYLVELNTRYCISVGGELVLMYETYCQLREFLRLKYRPADRLDLQQVFDFLSLHRPLYSLDFDSFETVGDESA